MTDKRSQASVRRPVVLAAILLVAAAVLLVALRSWLDRPAPETDIATETAVPAESEPEPEPAEPAFEPEPVLESIVVERPTPERIGVPVMVVTPPVPVTVVMLPARVASTGPEAATVTEAVRQSTLRALRAMPTVHVLEISAAELAATVPPNAGPLGEDNLVYLAVSRRHGARVVAEISEQTAAESLFWSLTLSVSRPNGGGSNGGSVARTANLRMGSDAETLGIRYADRIASDADRVARESSPVSSPGADAEDARSVFLDTSRPEQVRLRSLSQLLNGPSDASVMAAAVELATRSPSAATRQMALMLLRRSAYDATLAQPLSYALLSDVDAVVRKEAALALTAYAGDAAAAAALASAARNDSSSEVRLAARMAAMDFEEKQAFRRTTLLDESLTPAERLAPMFVDNSRIGIASLRAGSDGSATMEEALAYAEIVTATEDPELKLRGLSGLQGAMVGAMRSLAGMSSVEDSTLVASLIEVSQHADERVRRQALQSLTSVASLSGNAEARAALESVVANDPALATELNIERVLRSTPLRQLGPPR